MLTKDEKRKARNKRKQLKHKRFPAPVHKLDVYRRMKFEGELRKVVSDFYEALPTPEVMKAIRRIISKTIAKFARSKALAKSIEVKVEFVPMDETLVISYWHEGKEINVYDVYDMVNPGAKKIVGMHVGR
jgi:hypothetical protein